MFNAGPAIGSPSRSGPRGGYDKYIYSLYLPGWYRLRFAIRSTKFVQLSIASLPRDIRSKNPMRLPSRQDLI